MKRVHLTIVGILFVFIGFAQVNKDAKMHQFVNTLMSKMTLEEKIKKFIAEENLYKLSYSYDIYTDQQNLLVIHGIKSEVYSKDIVQVLKENKNFKITEPAIVVSSENYKVIQIKKNLDAYLASKNQ